MLQVSKLLIKFIDNLVNSKVFESFCLYAGVGACAIPLANTYNLLAYVVLPRINIFLYGQFIRQFVYWYICRSFRYIDHWLFSMRCFSVAENELSVLFQLNWLCFELNKFQWLYETALALSSSLINCRRYIVLKLCGKIDWSA